MTTRVLLVAALVSIGCTAPNPANCSDGACTDPSLPFCDVDGSVGGTPNTCIAIECVPQSFEGCRGDIALTCNSTGSNLDLITCPLGCDDVIGCRRCSNDDQCSGTTPICDQDSGECRTCVLDTECASNVCNDGACVDESDVVYASPGGADAGACTQSQPCSISRVVTVATSVNPLPTIRLLPGVYASALNVSTSTASPLDIVGSGATIANLRAISLTNGANTRIRGVSITALNTGLQCGDGTGPRTRFALTDAVLIDGGGSTLLTMDNCAAVIERTRLSGDSGIFGIRSDSSLDADRLDVDGTPASLLLFGERISVRLTNSVVKDATFNFATTDTMGPGSRVDLGHNTFVMTEPFSQFLCLPNSGSANRTVLVENNIIVALGATQAVDGSDCTLRNNIIQPQNPTPPDNIVADPQFLDLAASDFRVRATSPAVDAATPSPAIFTDHDFAGAPRPQGARADIGAFEQ